MTLKALNVLKLTAVSLCYLYLKEKAFEWLWN